MKTSLGYNDEKKWVDVIEHRNEVLLEGIEIFNDFLVVVERDSGLVRMNIKKWDNSDDYYLPINGETYSLSPGTNIDFNSKKLRYSFSSLNTPSSVIDFDMETKSFEIKTDRVGPSKESKKELNILIRIIRYTANGIEMEADLRHAETII